MNRFTTSISRWAALAAVTAAMAGTSAWAQSTPQATPETVVQQQQQPMPKRHSRFAQPQENMREQHLTRLKNLLQITPQQQAAWDAYVADAHPAPKQMKGEQKLDWRNMNTLQRLDARAQMRKERAAAAERRDQATRTFYNSLSSTQQKAFDSLPDRAAPHRKMRKHPHHF